MFESRFGFSGPPFQLSPDPGFYFESRGHARALSYLKYGVYQREGFIVVTGEIGAGKTTLVKTLLQQLDASQIVAAEVVNTQLDTLELLRAIGQAFGVPLQGHSKSQMLGTLEAFFTAVAAGGRRALLVVDEAQNLPLEAIEELRMLSNFQLGHRALLQSFLVGQPGLRTLLQSAPLEQLRQRIIAACHLGPMSVAETQAYGEHRLKRVGWAGRPHWDDTAWHRVHAHTDGVPRRINLLCSRLLLAASLDGQATLDGPSVDSVAGELQREVGLPAAA